MIRFLSHKAKQIVTTFYRIIQIKECDAKSVHEAIVNELEEDGIKMYAT